MNRGQTVTFLLLLDDVISVEDLTGDTDGDGVQPRRAAGRFNPIRSIRRGRHQPDLDRWAGLAAGARSSTATSADATLTRGWPQTGRPDSDDDMAHYGEELLELETDPNDADTDNDCLTDNEEHVGINPVVDEDGQGRPAVAVAAAPG